MIAAQAAGSTKRDADNTDGQWPNGAIAHSTALLKRAAVLPASA
jgi:hypothetical protein